ncbi:MAG: hypothetical protein OEM02_05255 [Desulfobulbaceae bacterium]|nr:hypothetical protein [Desulfobulbaceae bacterium]
MRENIIFTIFILSILFFNSSTYADQCDDVNTLAIKCTEEAEAAKSQGNYLRAATLYDQAAEYFKSITLLTDCTNLNISESALQNTESAQKGADSYRDYARNIQTIDRYNQARETFLNGKQHENNREYEKALKEIEKAADIWKNIAATSPQTKNGALAKEAATNANETITQILEIQQRNQNNKRHH